MDKFQQRDAIIFEKIGAHYSGGCAHFDCLTVEQIDKLAEIEGIVDWDDTQNGSPSFGDMYHFMKSHPGVYAHGYVISPKRKDCRVSITGLEFKRENDSKMLADFVTFANGADEITTEAEHLYCWWD